MPILTAYLDESGHVRDPKLNFVGMAGFVAPAANWDTLAPEWHNILVKAGFQEPFHMSEFAHSRGQFTRFRRNESERRRFFGKLLGAIKRSRATPIGAIISLNAYDALTRSQKDSFVDPYYVVFQICTRYAALKTDPGECVDMVYSRHAQFGTVNSSARRDKIPGRGRKLWYAMKSDPRYASRLRRFSAASPKDHAELQAADLFAYELVHEFENRIARPKDAMRHGLRQILSMQAIPAPNIDLLDRKELLYLVKRSGFPDQTGVAEVDEMVRLSAKQAMVKWMQERGGVSSGMHVVWDEPSFLK
ncbi:MAG: hypothetical protein OXI69_11990 [Acidobacteriota bacterium]|nr:hypothetical protein [Acidobacteriota bacterium]